MYILTKKIVTVGCSDIYFGIFLTNFVTFCYTIYRNIYIYNFLGGIFSARVQPSKLYHSVLHG